MITSSSKLLIVLAAVMLLVLSNFGRWDVPVQYSVEVKSKPAVRKNGSTTSGNSFATLVESKGLENHTLMYVHVGKTGGTTLDSVLRANCVWYEDYGGGDSLKNPCLEALSKNGEESATSRHTKVAFHMNVTDLFHEWIDDNITAFFVTVRHPINRLVSAFNMEHPSNKQRGIEWNHRTKRFYRHCFPTINHLVSALTNQSSSECAQEGISALRGPGAVGISWHLSSNYGYYFRHTIQKYPHRPVLVVRTENLWEDLMPIDKALGGTGNFPTKGLSYSYNSDAYKVREGLTSFGKQVFCCVLAEEFTVYEDILHRAINLSPSQVESTLSKLYSDCGLFNGSALSMPGVVPRDLFRTTGGEPFPWTKWANSIESGCLKVLGTPAADEPVKTSV